MATFKRGVLALRRLRMTAAALVIAGVVLCFASAAGPTTGARAEGEELLGISTFPYVEPSPQEGEEVSAEIGEWGGDRPISFTLQWLRCQEAFQHVGCTRISGATELRYVATTAD